MPHDRLDALILRVLFDPVCDCNGGFCSNLGLQTGPTALTSCTHSVAGKLSSMAYTAGVDFFEPSQFAT
jgi:hypothetical protein